MGKQNGVIEIRIKHSESNNTFDRYLYDMKYYGSSLLPGFRSGRRLNAFIAVVYFLVSLLPALEGNYSVMAVLICLPFIVFGLQGVLSRGKRKIDFLVKLIVVVLFSTILGVSSLFIIHDIRSGSFRSEATVKVLCSIPGALDKINIPAGDEWFYDAAAYLDKGNALPYIKKGTFFEHEGDVKTAKQNYAIALLLDADNYDAKYRMSRLLIVEGNNDKALKLLIEMLIAKPDFIPAFYDAAKLFYDSGKYEEAEKNIEIYLSKSPEDIEAYRLKAMILKGLGDMQSIGNKGSLGNRTSIVEVYNSAIEVDKFNALLYKERAKALLDGDRLNEAFYDIELAMEIGPLDPESYLIKGMVLMGMNDFKASAENFKRSLEIMSDNPMAKVLLEATLLKTENKNAEYKNTAIQKIEKVLGDNINNDDKASNANIKNANIKDAGLNYMYAGVLSNTGNYDKALQVINKAILLDNSRLEFYSLKCEAMLKKGDKAGAEELIETAFGVNAEDDYLNYVKGRYYLLINDYSSALQAFDKAIKRNPYLVRAYAGKAVVLSMTDKLEMADETLFIALGMDPDDYYSLYAKAAISFAHKRHQSALSSINKALKTGGQDVELLDLKLMIENAVKTESAT